MNEKKKNIYIYICVCVCSSINNFIKDVYLVSYVDINFYFLFFAKVAMVMQGDSDINLKGLRRKKKKMVDNRNRRPWSELPDTLLYMITKLLGTIDYLMFGCVCRAWRLYAVANRQEFMASQPPLVMFMPNRSKRVVASITSLMEGSIRQNSPTLLAKSVVGSHMGTW